MKIMKFCKLIFYEKSGKFTEILKNCAEVFKIPQIQQDDQLDLEKRLIKTESAQSRYRRRPYNRERTSESPPEVFKNISI